MVSPSPSLRDRLIVAGQLRPAIRTREPPLIKGIPSISRPWGVPALAPGQPWTTSSCLQYWSVGTPFNSYLGPSRYGGSAFCAPAPPSATAPSGLPYTSG